MTARLADLEKCSPSVPFAALDGPKLNASGTLRPAPSPASTMTPGQVAAALGGTVQAHNYGPPDPDAPRPAYGHALDPSDMTRRGPCPQCGGPTVAGWRERDYRTGRWREVTFPPSPCLPCRVAAALGMVQQLVTNGPEMSPPDVTTCAPPRGPERPESAPAVQTHAPAAGSASWRVQGRAVALSAGVLTVDGRQVAEAVTAADVTVYGRRLCVAGRPVADLAA